MSFTRCPCASPGLDLKPILKVGVKLVVCLEADHRNGHCCAHLGLITAVSRMGRVLTTVGEVAARPERGIDRLRNGLSRSSGRSSQFPPSSCTWADWPVRKCSAIDLPPLALPFIRRKAGQLTGGLLTFVAAGAKGRSGR